MGIDDEAARRHRADDALSSAGTQLRAAAVGLLAAALLALAATAASAREARLDCGFPTISGGYSTAFEIVIDYDARKVFMAGAGAPSGPLDANITDSTVIWSTSQPMPGQAVRWTLDRYTLEFNPFYRDAGSGTTAKGVPGKCILKQPKI
jgi:hypothetical protein